MAEFSKKRNKVYLFYIFLPFFIFGCAGKYHKYEESRFLLNTLISITIYDKDINKAKTAAQDSFAEIERIDRNINSHSENGEIYRLNNSNGEFIELSEETMSLLKKSIEIGHETNGKYDITIAPLFEAWNFEQEENASLPDRKVLGEKIKLVNYKNIIIEGNRAKLLKNGTKIETGGFLKGYAMYRAREILKKQKIESAFISATSTIETIGIKPNGEKWKIGLQNPSDIGEYLDILELSDMAIGVAGDYQTYIEVNGKKYHHILNTKTGYPVEGIKMVVILAKTGYEADMYDTAIFAAGLEAGTKIMKKHNFPGIIVDGDNNVHYIGDFKRYLKKEALK